MKNCSRHKAPINLCGCTDKPATQVHYRRKLPMPGLNMKPILHAMLSGWCDKSNALEEGLGYDVLGQRRPDEHFFLPYTDGDEKAASLLAFFGEWSNDILCVAADYGLTTELIRGKFQVVPVPSRPSEDHWWHSGEYKWVQDEDREGTGEYVWEPGRWEAPLVEEGPINQGTDRGRLG